MSATIAVTPLNTTVNLQSSDPSRVSLAQGSISGPGTVQLIIGPAPSAAVNDVALSAVASNSAGQDIDQKSVTVVELTSINIEYPLRNDNNGTFTSGANEDRIDLGAVTTPDILANTVTWEVDDDHRDAIDSGNPVDPQAAANVSFTANPPAAPNGRRAPLSYRIRAKLTIN